MQKILGSNPLDVYEIQSGQDPQEGELAVINSSAKLVEGDDATGVKCIGIIGGINSDDKVFVESGIILRKNSEIAPIARKDRGARAYVEDGETVALAGTVPAGVIVDVNSQGVFINVDPVAVGKEPGAHITDAAATDTAPVALTYAAPAGGATTDAEARASLAQSAVDVAAIRTRQGTLITEAVALKAKINLVLAAMEAHGILKSS